MSESPKLVTNLKGKHSYYDSEHRLFVACVECKRGHNGEKSCSAGWRHTVFRGQGCFLGDIIRPECPHKESSGNCPFFSERDGECLNDDGVCDSYSHVGQMLKRAESERNALCLRKTRMESEYNNLVEERDGLRRRISEIEVRVEVLAEHIIEVDKDLFWIVAEEGTIRGKSHTKTGIKTV